MQTHRRIGRREIKEDRFVTLLFSAWYWCTGNVRNIGFGVAGVAVIVVAALAFTSHRRDVRRQAVESLGEAVVAQQRGKTAEAASLYGRVISEYSGTGGAAEARVRLGNLLFEQGRYDEARNAFSGYLDASGDDDATLTYAATNGLAACWEERGDVAKAAETRQEYARSHADSPFAAWALLDAARCLAETGRRDEARSVLESVRDGHPESQAAVRAKQELLAYPKP